MVVIRLLGVYQIGLTCEREHFGSSLENDLQRKADKTGGRKNSIMRPCSEEWVKKKYGRYLGGEIDGVWKCTSQITRSMQYNLLMASASIP